MGVGGRLEAQSGCCAENKQQDFRAGDHVEGTIEVLVRNAVWIRVAEMEG